MTGRTSHPSGLQGRAAAPAMVAVALLFVSVAGCDPGSSAVERLGAALTRQVAQKTTTPGTTATKAPPGSGTVDAHDSGDPPGGSATGPEVTQTPDPTPLPPPAASPGPWESDPLPTPLVTGTPGPTPTPAPTPAFRQIDFEPAEFLNLYVPAPPDVTQTAGFPATASLRVMDRQTGRRLAESLFRWTSSAAAVATVSAGGLVQALSASSTLVEIRATALHNSSIFASTFVKVRDRGAVELDVELPSE